MSTQRVSDQDIEETLAAYQSLIHALHAASAPQWLDLEISMAQLKVLMAVARVEHCPVGKVADTLSVGLPTASHLVDKLVVAGLARRTEDPEDRRRTLVSLTDSGRELLTRLRQGGRDQLQSWITKLDAEDAAALRRGLQALADVAGAVSRQSKNGVGT